MSKKHLLEALQSEKIDMTGIDIKSVEKHIAEISTLEEMIDDFLASIAQPSHAFVRFKNVSFSPRKLFGKNIQYERGLEFVLLRAKQVDGEWVPDEDRVLVKGLMTEADVTDMLFKRNSEFFSPMTFTNIDGFNPELPTPSYTQGQKFGKSFYDSQQKAEVKVEQLLEQAQMLQDSSVSLSKNNKEPLHEAIRFLVQFFKSSDLFDLELDSETLDKHMLEVKTEVFSTLRAEAFKQDVALEDMREQSSRESIFKQYFDTHVDLSEKTSSSLLLARYAETLTEFGDKEKRKDVSRESGWLGADFALAESEKSEYGKGCVSFSQVQTTSTLMFGEPRHQQDIMELRLHFGVENQRDFGQVSIQDNGLLAYVRLSMTQMMDFIQSPFSQSYVKCTINNICGRYVPKVKEASSKKLRSLELSKQHEKPVPLLELLIELNKHLEGKGASKAYREKVLNLVDKIAEAAKPELNKREDAYLANRKVLGQDYLDATVEELNDAIGIIAERNPELVRKFDEVMKRLT
tara:strand:+ start:18383 stop:19936 length:1554 start_codon:yes stop_codon:yes gene_type:complete